MRKYLALLFLPFLFSCENERDENFCNCGYQQYERKTTTKIENDQWIHISATEWQKRGSLTNIQKMDCNSAAIGTSISVENITWNADGSSNQTEVRRDIECQ